MEMLSLAEHGVPGLVIKKRYDKQVLWLAVFGIEAYLTLRGEGCTVRRHPETIVSHEEAKAPRSPPAI